MYEVGLRIAVEEPADGRHHRVEEGAGRARRRSRCPASRNQDDGSAARREHAAHLHEGRLRDPRCCGGRSRR